MIGIYKITSPNNKVYIGQSVDIKKRWVKHKCAVVKSKLYNSFVKYGVENHIFEVVEECDIKLLNERERYYQDFYNVIFSGLNLKLTNTNDKSGFLSQEIKDKISKRKRSIEEIEKSKIARTGLKRSLEQKKKIKENRSEYIMTNDIKLKISNSNKGKIFSKETRLKLSKAKTERSIKLILDNNTGVFYYSCEEASFFTGYKKSHLSKMLTGNLKNKTNLIYV